jgi:hypothetical protein
LSARRGGMHVRAARAVRCGAFAAWQDGKAQWMSEQKDWRRDTNTRLDVTVNLADFK